MHPQWKVARTPTTLHLGWHESARTGDAQLSRYLSNVGENGRDNGPGNRAARINATSAITHLSESLVVNYGRTAKVKMAAAAAGGGGGGNPPTSYG